MEAYETETGDLVTCANCGFTGEVETGADACPECKMDGALQWTAEVTCGTCGARPEDGITDNYGADGAPCRECLDRAGYRTEVRELDRDEWYILLIKGSKLLHLAGPYGARELAEAEQEAVLRYCTHAEKGGL